jgi:ribonuclease G
VNTGKNIKGKEAEGTIFQVNKEAAEEVAVQIRLRNLSGIIIVDFINMKNSDQEVELLNYLRDLTAADPVPTKVVDMTPLGLVEITRKKVKMSLKEQFK